MHIYRAILVMQLESCHLQLNSVISGNIIRFFFLFSKHVEGQVKESSNTPDLICSHTGNKVFWSSRKGRFDTEYKVTPPHCAFWMKKNFLSKQQKVFPARVVWKTDFLFVLKMLNSPGTLWINLTKTAKPKYLKSHKICII